MKFLIIKNNTDVKVRHDHYTLSADETLIKEVYHTDLEEWKTQNNKKNIKPGDILRVTPMSVINYIKMHGYCEIDRFIGCYIYCDTIDSNSVYYNQSSSIHLDLLERVDPCNLPKDFNAINFVELFMHLPQWPNKVYGQLFNYTPDNLVTYWDENLGKKFTLKPGRFLTQFGYNSSWCETFTEGVKALNTEIEFKEVRGLDIIKYYNEKEYYNNQGDLGGSCMRYANTQAKLGFYAAMPDISMLVGFINGKVVGRTILWNSLKFMDRIYTSYTYMQKHFLKWAHDRDYITKTKQSRYADDSPDLQYHVKMLDGLSKESVFLHFNNINIMPYMDSFKWWRYDNNSKETHLLTKKYDASNTNTLENSEPATVGLDRNKWLNPELIVSFDDLLQEAYGKFKTGTRFMSENRGKGTISNRFRLKIEENRYIMFGHHVIYDAKTKVWAKRNIPEQLELQF